MYLELCAGALFLLEAQEAEEALCYKLRPGRLHKVKERNASLARRKKLLALRQEGCLRCAAKHLGFHGSGLPR